MLHKRDYLMTSCRRAALLMSGLVLAVAAAPGPARAQGAWFDFLLGRDKPAQSPAQPAAPARQEAAPATAAKPVPLPPKRPAPATTATTVAQVPAPPAAQALPPPPEPQVVTAAAPAAPAIPAGPLTEKQIVERANGYFNSIKSLVGNFAQIGGDGRRLTGNLYLQRPGKVRFEYDSPATLEVIADGTSVAVRDSKLATQDIYPIGQTPLKFLLRDRIELGRDLKVTEAAPEAEGVRISIEDRSTLGGTSKITLYFDKDVTDLSRWRIIDAQGFQTTVSLANLERNASVDQQMFKIEYQRLPNDR
ncbi:MAG TPA: outer-membrane lipoprotein carrier protein LolA [Beijerinckiaceae bacterium]|nr:outer-membrane lipoprotein carrier protein LolA [Beijerinckiaceae bacterium]